MPGGRELPATRLGFAVTPVAPMQARRALERLTEDLPEELRFRLRLLVSELVANSVRHAGLAPTDTIELELEQLPESIRVAVHDHGRGFRLATRSPGARALHHHGLDLVDALASRWGTERGGRTVWFELATGQASARERPAGDDPKRRALRVVIADDYPLFAMSLAGSLGLSEDVEVVGIAEDGGYAVDLVAALAPDLALIDLRMPVADGIEVTQRLRAQRTKTTIAIMSGLDDEHMIADAVLAGAAAFVSKDDLARDPVGVVLRLAETAVSPADEGALEPRRSL